MTRLFSHGLIFAVGLLMIMTACGSTGDLSTGSEEAPLASNPTSSAPEETVDTATADINLYDYESLKEKYLGEVLGAHILAATFADAQELDPATLVLYFVYNNIPAEENVFNQDFPWEEGRGLLVPEDIVENAIQSHFDVPVEHIQKAEGSTYAYVAEKKAYAVDGVGGFANCNAILAERSENELKLTYDIYADVLYYGRGALHIALTEDGRYRYLSNKFAKAPGHLFVFPSALWQDVHVTDNTITVYAGDKSSIGYENGDQKDYDGKNLSSVVGFYEDAIAALGATGADIAGKYADGWAWSGTYNDGKVLSIVVTKKTADDESYTAEIVYDEDKDGFVKALSPVTLLRWCWERTGRL